MTAQAGNSDLALISFATKIGCWANSGATKNTKDTKKRLRKHEHFMEYCLDLQLLFQADRLPVELPIVLGFHAQVRQGGDGSIHKIDLFCELPAFGRGAADDQEA